MGRRLEEGYDRNGTPFNYSDILLYNGVEYEVFYISDHYVNIQNKKREWLHLPNYNKHVLVKDKETPMQITMEGEYAYAKDPYTKVRILCVDRPKLDHCIVSVDEEGDIRCHTKDGKGVLPKYNLVPLKKRPVERWAVEVNGVFFTSYPSEEVARQRALNYNNSRVFLMREVQE